MSGSTRRSNNAVGLAVVGLILVVGFLGVLALRWYSGRTPDRSISSAASGPPILLQEQVSPTPGEAAASSQAASGSAELLPAAVVARLGAVLTSEDFDAASSDLFSGPGPGEPGRLDQKAGRLLVEQSQRSTNEPAFLVLTASRPPALRDGVVATEALLAVGGEQAGYALYVRRSPDLRSGYALWVQPRLRSLQLWREVRTARNELAQVQTEALWPDRANQVVLLAEGTQFEAFVNGQSVLTASDRTFGSGRLGLAVGLPFGGPAGEVRVELEDFQVFGLR
jgi:hypothetical protein